MRVRQNRREFLGLTGAAIGGFVSGSRPAAAAVDSHNPDLVVFDAKVYTVDSGRPKAEAFAVKAGRFSAIGSTAEMKALIGKEPRPSTPGSSPSSLGSSIATIMHRATLCSMTFSSAILMWLSL